MLDKRKISISIVLVMLLVVIASILYTNRMTREMTLEEQQKIQRWADAEQHLNNDELTSSQIDSLLNIIQENKTIPAYLVDKDGVIVSSINQTTEQPSIKKLHGPIEIRITDAESQYIYYDDSVLLKRLQLAPYIQFLLVILFIIVAIFIIYTEQRSEQNRVWVGLSKETAHQLGTPISSLYAWIELLEARYPNDELIPQLRPDIERLQVVAERFSKIGSEPELKVAQPALFIRQSVQYMSKRVSQRIQIDFDVDPTVEEAQCMLNPSLFSWVLENLIKNAVDAMSGRGKIGISMKREDGNHICILVQDDGKGMDKKSQSQIFRPGYTTKKRGWGLGLSLSKRIIEDYHRGHLLLKSSEPGVGTCFLIRLEECK